MDRRQFLALSALGISGIAGCITQPNGGGIMRRDPESFQRCPTLSWPISDLPEPARNEAETALEDGVYETDSELYLPHLLDPDESYLERGTGGETKYYKIEMTEDGQTTRLKLVETIPSWGVDPLQLENQTSESLTVEVRVVRARGEEIVIEMSDDIQPNEQITIGDYDRRFGRYTATVAVNGTEKTVSWREDRELPDSVTLVLETVDADSTEEESQIELSQPARPRIEPVYCPKVWEEESG